MACKVCGRGGCVASFHSFEEQELAEMSRAELRERLRAAEGRVRELEAERREHVIGAPCWCVEQPMADKMHVSATHHAKLVAVAEAARELTAASKARLTVWTRETYGAVGYAIAKSEQALDALDAAKGGGA